MADLENTELESQETEITDSQVTDSTHKSELEDDGRKSTIARIAEILRGKKSEPAVDADDTEDSDDVEPESDETVESEEQTSTDEYEEIDPRFVEAARSYGWSDDRIIEYAEAHDDHDLVMLTSMMERDTVSEEKDIVTIGKETPDVPSDLDTTLAQLEQSEDIGDLTKQVLRSLATDLKSTRDRLASLQSEQEGARKSDENKEWKSRLVHADEQFDTASKQFPELGQTKTLKRFPDGSLNPNDPAVRARQDLFRIAVSLFQSGTSWEQSMKDAVRWYKGGREDVIEDGVLRKIKANEKRLSPKREKRHQTRKFNSEQEEKASVVNNALSKYGVELPE